MPLPESSKSKMANYPSDFPCMHDEFVELLWDNGPVVQGPSSRPRKSSMFTMLPPSGIRVSEKDTKDNPFPKIGHFKVSESKVNNFATSGPSSSFGINAQDDDIVPWINYPMEDPIHNDYCSEFLNDYSGADLNSVRSQTSVVPAVRSGFLDQVGRDSHNTERGHASASSRIRESQPLQLPTQLNSSTPCSKSSEMDLGMGNSSKAHNRERGSNGVMNFSHFFRPVTLVRANHEGVAKQEISNKTTFAASSNPVESPVIGSTSGLRGVFGTQDQLSSVQANTDLMLIPKPPKEVITVDESKVICEGESSRKNNKYNTGNADSRSPERVQSSSFAASAALPEKRNEAVVVSSCASLSSSEDAESNDNKHRGKRKHQEGEESGYQSEDLEYESMELKKPLPVQGKSKKRSRAAEVHNLSEKRRRDRINERMRALQELIPNCNKTDKASMLDEAIEYLKSLQMQLQIMAMRTGLCMPPMMMQHMRAPTMASMGIGMGMGMGLSYGMGMYDVNVSPGCSFIPVQGPQFPCSSIPGSQGVHPLPTGSNNLQMFGIPGTGLSVPLPYRPPSTTTEDAKCSPDRTMNVGNQHEQNKTLEKT